MDLDSKMDGTTTLALVAAGVLLLYVLKNKYTKTTIDKFSKGLDSVTQDKGELKAEVIEKWNRPLDKTPVHLDLPRLAKKMEIKVDGTVIWHIDEEELTEESMLSNRSSPAQTVANILLTLANAMEADDLIEKMKKKFPEYFEVNNPNTDVSKRLLEFLMEVVGDDSKVVRILKGCNQSIIAPPVLRLKKAALPEFPYKDVRSGWRIYISINKRQVVISHRKWERSFEDDSFQFRWQFDMVFDAHVTQLQDISVKIVDLQFGSKDTPQTQKAFKEKMKAFAAWNEKQ